MFRLGLLTLILLLLVPAVTSAQDDENATTFDFLEDAVVRYGERGDWDSRHTSAGAVIFHDGQYHMFRNGYQGWPFPSQVGYLTSDDGITWEEVQEEPVFMHDQIPFDVKLALLNAVIIEDDGTWVFYFSLWAENGINRPAGMVRATASSPTDEWTMDDSILIEPSTDEDAWDSNFIGISDVIRVGDQYWMYYGGNDGDNWAVGLAISDDGINWEKQPEPVLTKALDWEIAIQDPRVVITEEGYTMLYNSGNGNYNLATSTDGITWERAQDTPMVPRDTFRRTPWVPTLAYHDNTYFVYLEVDSRAGTDIFVGTYEGTLD